MENTKLFFCCKKIIQSYCFNYIIGSTLGVFIWIIEAYGDKAMDLIKVMKDLKGMLPQGDALISRDGGAYFTSLAEDILNNKKTVREVMAELDAASKPPK